MPTSCRIVCKVGHHFFLRVSVTS